MLREWFQKKTDWDKVEKVLDGMHVDNSAGSGDGSGGTLNINIMIGEVDDELIETWNDLKEACSLAWYHCPPDRKNKIDEALNRATKYERVLRGKYGESSEETRRTPEPCPRCSDAESECARFLQCPHCRRSFTVDKGNKVV